MPYYPYLQQRQKSRLLTEVFQGLNRNQKIADGEWNDEMNMSSTAYPLLSPRKKRGCIATCEQPQGIEGKEKLWMVAGGKLYADGEEIAGIELTSGEKQLVSFGAYLTIWPDKVYINTVDISEHGEIEEAYESAGEVKYSLARADGSDYENVTIGPNAPDAPENGEYWLDTNKESRGLKVYSAQQGMWLGIATVYTRIESEGIGLNFADGDGVTISGVVYEGDDETLKAQLEALNATHLIYGHGDDYITVVNMLDTAYTQTEGTVSITRTVPTLDYVIEHDNRLWGCHYGAGPDGKMENRIFASKLGDFKNWNAFSGLDSDSYYVDMGSDGEFTGAVSYGGYAIFFKENVIHKVYGSRPANFKSMDTSCRGVGKECHKSIAAVDEMLFYKSSGSVMMYDGSVPQEISDKLGEVRGENVCGGGHDNLYYLAITENGRQSLLCYDIKHALWHREDDMDAVMMTVYDDDLIVQTRAGMILSMSGRHGEKEEAQVKWYCQSGLMGWEMEDHKYQQRFNIRLTMEKEAKCKVEIEYDDSGIWHSCGVMQGDRYRTRTVLLPIIPRRCDHLRIRLSGEGNVQVYSMGRKLTLGGDGHYGKR